jgi:hypothetical protein
MVRTMPARQEPASSNEARRLTPIGAAQPAAAKSAPSTCHTHPSAGKNSEKSSRLRHRRSRRSLPPDDGHSSWPGSRQLKPPVAPQSPHATVRRIRAPRGSYCTTWPNKSHSCPERREGAKAGEIGLPQPHTKQRDRSGSRDPKVDRRSGRSHSTPTRLLVALVLLVRRLGACAVVQQRPRRARGAREGKRKASMEEVSDLTGL